MVTDQPGLMPPPVLLPDPPPGLGSGAGATPPPVDGGAVGAGAVGAGVVVGGTYPGSAGTVEGSVPDDESLVDEGAAGASPHSSKPYSVAAV